MNPITGKARILNFGEFLATNEHTFGWEVGHEIAHIAKADESLADGVGSLFKDEGPPNEGVIDLEELPPWPTFVDNPYYPEGGLIEAFREMDPRRFSRDDVLPCERGALCVSR